MVAQAWALKPAPDADLERAEAELQRLRRLVAELQKLGPGAAAAT
jgi:type II secretory pathway component PulM